MYNGSTILLCVTIFVIHKQCLIRAHCSIVTVTRGVMLELWLFLKTVLHCYNRATNYNKILQRIIRQQEFPEIIKMYAIKLRKIILRRAR
jgi:hypothetical protein